MKSTRKPNTTEIPKTLSVDLPPEVLKALDLHARARGLRVDEAEEDPCTDLEFSSNGVLALLDLLVHRRLYPVEEPAVNSAFQDQLDSGLLFLQSNLETTLATAVELTCSARRHLDAEVRELRLQLRESEAARKDLCEQLKKATAKSA